MSGKAERLARLLAIRRLREDLDKTAWEMALAKMAEVETAIGMQGTARGRARHAAHASLNEGDRGNWLMADAQAEVAGWNQEKLEVLLAARAAEVAPAREKFLESRREHEQVKVLVDAARQTERVAEARREQAEVDDWFLGKHVRSAMRSK